MLICSLAKPDLNSKWLSVLFVSFPMRVANRFGIYLFPLYTHTQTPLLLSVYQGEEKTLVIHPRPKMRNGKDAPWGRLATPSGHDMFQTHPSSQSLKLISKLKGKLRSLSGKELACQCRRWERRGFNSWVGKIPWGKKWRPAPIFLPEESHAQRNLVGYSPWGCKKGGKTVEPRGNLRTV